MENKIGKLIVIDGTDGSGKATQTALLVERMRKENIPVETISFPQYNKKSAGLVEEYLSGKYGTVEEVGAKKASIFFAVDRFDASFEIRKSLNKGINIIADRYTGSNLGHQGSKIDSKKERLTFYEWNRNLEYSLFNIPKPDINIILHIPTKITVDLAKKRGGWKGKIKTDIHETNINHLQKAEQTYLELAKLFDEFKLIECLQNNQLLSPTKIHEMIWDKIQSIIII